MEITQEMKDYSDKRTNYHIGLVRKYLDKAIGYYPQHKEALEECKRVHDQSKMVEPEYTPYVLVNWKYKCQADGVPFEPSEEQAKAMHEATFTHIKRNHHHPECSDIMLEDNPINFENRDKPSDVMVDGTLMEDEYIIEMCCDWSAIAEERGENTPQDWAKRNVNIRWKFNKEQEKLIYEVLGKIWE